MSEDQTTEDTAQATEDTAQATEDTAQATEGEETPNEQKAEGNEETKVPEKYDLGEDIDPEAPLAKTMAEAFKEVGLDNDAAQKLAAKYQEFALAQVDAWLEETKVDEEIGGDALDANVAVAGKALEAYGTPELREFLDASGLGNHKEVIRFFYKVGQTLTEDNPGRGAPAAEPKDRVSILYKS